MNWWHGRIWLNSQEKMEDIEKMPLRRLLKLHKLLDYKAERDRIIHEV